VPSPVGGLVACPQKKINFSLKKLCNSEQVLVLFFLYYSIRTASASEKVGDYPQS